MITKRDLILTGMVEDCDALDKYYELISQNTATPRQRYCTNKHHIIPRSYYKENCLTVDNSPENLVNLTHSDHFLAHYYLALCCVDRYKYYNQLALNYIVGKYQLSVQDILQDLDTYQRMREELRRSMGEQRRGKPFPHTPEWQARLKIAHQARKGIPTGRTPWNKGKTGVTHHTAETREKIRQASLERPVSEEKRERCRQANLGNTHKLGYKASSDTCRKQSENNGKNRPVQCVETGEIFYNISDCARHLRTNIQYIRRLILERRPLTSRIIKSWPEERKEMYRKYYGCNFKFYQEEN